MRDGTNGRDRADIRSRAAILDPGIQGVRGAHVLKGRRCDQGGRAPRGDPLVQAGFEEDTTECGNRIGRANDSGYRQERGGSGRREEYIAQVGLGRETVDCGHQGRSRCWAGQSVNAGTCIIDMHSLSLSSSPEMLRADEDQKPGRGPCMPLRTNVIAQRAHHLDMTDVWDCR